MPHMVYKGIAIGSQSPLLSPHMVATLSCCQFIILLRVIISIVTTKRISLDGQNEGAY